MKKNQKGFTLMEMLIVVAVIAILVAVAIPVMNAQMHKVKVRTDWANLRAYYAELQTDYILTGKENPNIVYPKFDLGKPGETAHQTITFLNGQTVKLKAGVCMLTIPDGKGYQLVYDCDEGPTEHPECSLRLNVENTP